MRRLWLIPSLLLLGCEALWGGFNKPHFELAQASRSSAIALSDDESILVAVNPDHGSISIFDPSTLRRTAVVMTQGKEPSSVVLHPSGDTAYVANRADATVVQINGLHSAAPQVVAKVAVGSEPTGLALSPRGRLLFVAEFAESSISVIDTQDLTLLHTISGVPNPRTILVTNNFDGQDDDEMLVVPHYFGEPRPNKEGQNNSRLGRVDLYSLRDFSFASSIELDTVPAAVTGSDDASPNELAGAVIAADGRLYLTGQAVSPEPPSTADHNVTPMVHVVDLVTLSEVTQGAGSVSLPGLLAPLATPATVFLADPVDIDFVRDRKSFGFVGYVVSRGTDTVERLVFDPDKGTVSAGSPQNLQIDASGNDTIGRCRAPIGGVVSKSQRMFLNCWLSRTLAVLDLTSQTLQSTFKTVDTEPLDPKVLRGVQAFHSARGRMAQQGRIACASCHPDGRSDGITWFFPNGPRQTPSLDNVFSHHGSSQLRRVLSWTGNADEIADFEDLLRTVMGGHGAISTANSPTDCGDLTKEVAVPLNPPLGSPNQELQMMQGSCSTTWDDIESYLAQLRPVRRLQSLSNEAIARGAALFGSGGPGGGCTKCHSEAGWTLAHRSYTPAAATNMSLATSVRFARPAAWPAFYTAYDGEFQLAPQPAAAESPPVSIPPLQVSCVLRNVSTFGSGGSEAQERSSAGGRAQGRGGYNIPGLYSLAVTPPFFHHGRATTLEALLQNTEFTAHLTAGAANFDVTNEGARSDLISFLLALDGDAAELAAPAGFNAGCATQ